MFFTSFPAKSVGWLLCEPDYIISDQIRYATGKGLQGLYNKTNQFITVLTKYQTKGPPNLEGLLFLGGKETDFMFTLPKTIRWHS
jgi:hypothetical protein